MRFTQLTPAIAAFPELYSYYCDACGEAVKNVGPLKVIPFGRMVGNCEQHCCPGHFKRNVAYWAPFDLWE
jgi:hypothetical protein